MAKKQTRRSISVSRVTYERLKAFCETNNISMSQFVETRVGDFLGEGEEGAAAVMGTVSTTMTSMTSMPRPAVTHTTATGMSAPAPRPHAMSSMSGGSTATPPTRSFTSGPVTPRVPAALTSAAARFAVEPPPPIIKPRADAPAPAPITRTADQIFTF
jgi:hypothetical protein